MDYLPVKWGRQLISSLFPQATVNYCCTGFTNATFSPPQGMSASDQFKMSKFSITMKLKYIKDKFFPVIKVISTVLITSAISLELWNIYRQLNSQQIPNILHPILWLGRLALIAHFIEGIIAAFSASSKGEIPLKYGTYTFFVGTVGLVELFTKTEGLPPHAARLPRS